MIYRTHKNGDLGIVYGIGFATVEFIGTLADVWGICRDFCECSFLVKKCRFLSGTMAEMLFSHQILLFFSVKV